MSQTMTIPSHYDGEQTDIYKTAYDRGQRCDAHLIAEESATQEEAELAILNGFEHMTESARWCHHILPDLRAVAGYDDSGMGTYTLDPDDECHYRLDELTDAYRCGYVDGALAAVEQARPALFD